MSNNEKDLPSYEHILIKIIDVLSGDEKTFIPKEKYANVSTRSVDRCLRFNADELTEESIEKFLKGNVKKYENCKKVLKSYSKLNKQVLQTLVALSRIDLDALNVALQSVKFPSKNGSSVRVPRVLERIVEINDPVQGRAVGKGELVSVLLFSNVTGEPNGAYDLTVNGIERWHVKDHRNDDSTFVGRSNQKNKSKKKLLENKLPEWRNSPVIKFIRETLGIEGSFGMADAIDEETLRRLKERYGLSDACDALEKFQQELDVVARSQLGTAKGVLFVVNDGEGLCCLQRVDMQNVYFHSISRDNIKITHKPNRFAEKLTKNVERENALLEKEQLALMKQREKLVEIQRFIDAWNNAPDLDTLSTSSCLPKKQLQNRGAYLRQQGHKLKRFKRMSKVKKVKKNENRNRRRINETSLEGSLELN